MWKDIILGEMVRNPDMARTHRRITEHGVENLYTGAIAGEIAADGYVTELLNQALRGRVDISVGTSCLQ